MLKIILFASHILEGILSLVNLLLKPLTIHVELERFFVFHAVLLVKLLYLGLSLFVICLHSGELNSLFLRLLNDESVLSVQIIELLTL